MSLRFFALLLVVSLGIPSAQAEENEVKSFLGGILNSIIEPGEVDGGAYRDDGDTPTIDPSNIAATGGTKKPSPVGGVSDQAGYEAALGRVLESSRTGVASNWKSPASGQHGTITPTRTVMDGGKPCREYESTRISGNRTLSFAGVACRAGKARWPIREEEKIETAAEQPWKSPDDVWKSPDESGQPSTSDNAESQLAENELVPDPDPQGHSEASLLPESESQPENQPEGENEEQTAQNDSETETPAESDTGQTENLAGASEAQSSGKTGGSDVQQLTDAVQSLVGLFGNKARNNNNAEENSQGEEAENTENTDDTENTENTENTDDTENTENTDDTENTENTEITENADNTAPSSNEGEGSTGVAGFESTNGADDQPPPLQQASIPPVIAPRTPPVIAPRAPPPRRPRVRPASAPRLIKISRNPKGPAMRFKYRPVSGAKIYQVKLVGGKAKVFAIRKTPKSSYTLTRKMIREWRKRRLGKKGYVQLRARVGNKWSPWSQPKWFDLPTRRGRTVVASRGNAPGATTPTRPRRGRLAVPRLVKETPLKKKSAIRFRYSPVKGAKKYEFRIRQKNGNTFKRRQLTGPSFVIGARLSRQWHSKLPGQRASVQLRAKVRGKWGKWSPPKAFVMPGTKNQANVRTGRTGRNTSVRPGQPRKKTANNPNRPRRTIRPGQPRKKTANNPNRPRQGTRSGQRPRQVKCPPGQTKYRGKCRRNARSVKGNPGSAKTNKKGRRPICRSGWRSKGASCTNGIATIPKICRKGERKIKGRCFRK